MTHAIRDAVELVRYPDDPTDGFKDAEGMAGCLPADDDDSESASIPEVPNGSEMY